MNRDELTYTLKEVFLPTPKRIILALLFTVAAHFYLIESAIRQTGAEQLSGASSFWITNLVDSLPYLETDSKALKFITFFVASYTLVWVVSKAFSLFDKAQVMVVKRLRRQT